MKAWVGLCGVFSPQPVQAWVVVCNCLGGSLDKLLLTLLQHLELRTPVLFSLCTIVAYWCPYSCHQAHDAIDFAAFLGRWVCTSLPVPANMKAIVLSFIRTQRFFSVYAWPTLMASALHWRAWCCGKAKYSILCTNYPQKLQVLENIKGQCIFLWIGTTKKRLGCCFFTFVLLFVHNY